MRNILIEDIYALEFVPDSSLWMLISLSLTVVVVVSLVVRKLIKNYHFKKYREIQLALEVLKSCDFTQIKNTAYQISYYGKVLAMNEKQEAIFTKILKALEVYKYEENPQDFSLEFKALFETFMRDVESVHV